VLKGDKLVIRPHVHARAFDAELVIVDLDRGEYYGLNPVGARVWERFAAGLTLEQVVAVVVQDFDVDALTAERDVMRIVNEWIQLGIAAPEGTS
jgi:hypothetical protein